MSILKFEHYFWGYVFGFLFSIYFFGCNCNEGILLYVYEPKKKSSFYDAIR